MSEEISCILDEEKKHFKDILLNKEKALEEELRININNDLKKELETVKNILRNMDDLPTCQNEKDKMNVKKENRKYPQFVICDEKKCTDKIEDKKEKELKLLLDELEKIKPGLIKYLVDNKVHVVEHSGIEARGQTDCSGRAYAKPEPDENPTPYYATGNKWIIKEMKKMVAFNPELTDKKEIKSVFLHEYAHCKEQIETTKKRLTIIDPFLDEDKLMFNIDMFDETSPEVEIYTFSRGIEWAESDDKLKPEGMEKRAQKFVQRLPVKQFEDIEKVKNHGG